ncbi:GIY-YIG nuclease family protein [Geothrix terrae]|uniref:GIY-YIG nuclease family protein n=1 Tax=Geothrix terrae TaxID=2922720 RepID=UPI001FAE3C7F|nr:GIY-YIG nuclease family protein [Geothrix terrae]
MEFNDLLAKQNIDPKQVLVLRHRPKEPRLHRALPLMAADRPDLYNAYQQTQTPQVQAAMLKAPYVASFVGHSAGKAFFVGLYRNAGSLPLTFKQYWELPCHKELKKFGMTGYQGGRDPILWFELERMKFYSEWAGKLIVDWPGIDRSWWRWSERNHIPISAILEEDLLNPEMAAWNQISLAWEELSLLPGKWREALRQWRGIYLIFDEADGKGYVGSAYGRQNLLGRWTNYAASGHGGNKHLKARDPIGFRFTILQLVAPDMPAEDVIALESSWKDRLHTREPFGLNAN